jgi:hypothetical protein
MNSACHRHTTGLDLSERHDFSGTAAFGSGKNDVDPPTGEGSRH